MSCVMRRRYVTFLTVDGWAILAWDGVQQRVQEYVTELWTEWGMYEKGIDDVSFMALYIDHHEPTALSQGDSDAMLADLDKRVPGIAAALGRQTTHPPTFRKH